MENAPAILAELQSQFNSLTPNWLPDDQQIISFSARRGGLIDLRIYVSPDENEFVEVQRSLAEADLAATLNSLIFEGPDEGANGTREWNFRPLLETGATFPELTKLYIEPSSPGDHNGSILGFCYDEEGQSANLIRRMPKLRDLTIPSAPSEEFFQMPSHPLVTLRVDFGYHRQDLPANMSRSSAFPCLETVDLGVMHPQSAGNPDVIASYDEYAELFDSPAFSTVREVTLRNPGLTEDELSKLLALRRDLQITLIQVHASYKR